MFFKSARWQIKKESIQLNHAPKEEKVPKTTLKDRHSNTMVSLYPYRIIFDPYIPSDAYCCLDIRLDTLNNFIQELNEDSLYLTRYEKKGKKCKWIFDIDDEKSINYYLNKLEDHLLRTTHEFKENLKSEFNQLRKFVKLPPRTIYPYSTDDISDEEMAYSAFGKRFREHNL